MRTYTNHLSCKDLGPCFWTPESDCTGGREAAAGQVDAAAAAGWFEVELFDRATVSESDT